MKIKLLLFILAMGKIVFAQNYYNKNIDYNNSLNGFANMIIDNDTIYCIGTNSGSNVQELSILKIDNHANVILSNSFSYESSPLYSGGDGTNFLKFGNQYIATGCSSVNSTTINGLVYKLNKLCDTIWIKKRNSTNGFATIYRYSLKCSNSEFLSIGDVSYFDSTLNKIMGKIYLVKFDTLANIIWQKEYGLQGANEFVKGIKSSADGGYYIYGSKQDNLAYKEFYLLKIDVQGNIIWQRTWGSIYHDCINDIVEMPDGKLLVSGYTSEDYFGHEIYPAYLALLSADGSQRFWEKKYLKYLSNENALSNIYKNTDGTYHIWGWVSNSYKDITRPILMTFSSTFDSLDVQYYSFWNGPGAQNYIRDIVRMPDNGYIASGFGWDNTHGEDGWLLRIDSNGCANASCTPLAVAPSPLGRVGVGLYPNPANDIVTIESSETINKIEIINAQGQVMETINCNNTTNYQLFTINYPNGIYCYRFSFSSNTTSNGKFLIQH